MPGAESDEIDRCELCGVPCGEVDGGPEQLRMQLTRDDGGDVLYWAGDFCSQAHAAEWLQQPLPEALSPEPPPGPTTWTDRVATGGCLAVFLLLLVLVVVGGWTAVHFLLDRL